MQIHGLSKLTLLDFPEHLACTLFTGGCNFRCPFCHNASLVLNPGGSPVISEDDLFSFLKRRKGILEGVCITGGEPTLSSELPDFISRIRSLGYLVKLDTNGSHPEMLSGLLKSGVLDYVAMDIKNSREHYAMTVGLPEFDLTAVEESIQLLMHSTVSHEFRTTVVRELHTAEDLHSIGTWLAGDSLYFLQVFQDSGELLNCGKNPLSAYSPQQMKQFRELLLPLLPNTQLRGI